ncbi:cytochrome P450 [Phanerochaete sordida]|uniref:Cytochrome P450 n=1 Tax=Phanerochaete sordida TaxID=48140 RepID=A0A9P3GFA6_9APHY|nr:cytochrome P450 [Phanerochaete sordida]
MFSTMRSPEAAPRCVPTFEGTAPSHCCLPPSPPPPPTARMFSSVVFTLLALFVASRVMNYFKYRKQTAYLPAMHCLVSPISALGASLPTRWWNPGHQWQWKWRLTVYRDLGAETIAAVPFLFGVPVIYTSSLEVAKQIVTTKTTAFHKSRDTTEITLIWGPNIFAANGDEWKKHKRVISPAFSQETYASVWENTARVVDEMAAAEGWAGRAAVDIPVVNTLTYKAALILISTCGFGNALSWRTETAPGAAVSFADALATVASGILVRLLVPRWAYKLPIKKLQEVETAYTSLGPFMRDLIARRRREMEADGAAARDDILSLMIKASHEEKYNMSDAELMGNTFLLLSAGHDTSARTLDAALMLLALHPEIQEDVHREVTEIMPTDDDFTFANSARLVKTRSVFLEASRLFPAGFMLIRDAAEDTVLRGAGRGGADVPVPRGTRVVVDMVGLHHNPALYPDPEAFVPARWHAAHENELTMFSFGARTCPGRRFALTEGTCFLARLLRRWRVAPLTLPGEDVEAWRARVYQGRMLFNFGVGEVPVRFEARG